MDLSRKNFELVSAASKHYAEQLRALESGIRSLSVFTKPPDNLSDALASLTGANGIIMRIHETKQPIITLPDEYSPVLKSALASYASYLQKQTKMLTRLSVPSETFANLSELAKAADAFLKQPQLSRLTATSPTEKLIKNYQTSLSLAETLSTIENAIRAFDIPSLKHSGAHADYFLKIKEGTVGVEVKANNPSRRTLEIVAMRVKQIGKGISKYYLVTPISPLPEQFEAFRTLTHGARIPIDWISVQDLLNRFTVNQRRIDIASPKGLTDLQTRAITKDFSAYASAPIGPTPEAAASSDDIYSYLMHQFPYSLIAELASQGDIEKQLGLNDLHQGAIVVLSDVKNFTSLVKHADSRELQEAMTKYYRLARKLVWDHKGVLDKFIGDATLAIFNYPKNDTRSITNAVKFACALISEGNKILFDLADSINEPVQTGTRIGMATGALRVLNIGDKGIQVSFVGDTINLAARLEKECVLNGLLSDHKSIRLLRLSNQELYDELGAPPEQTLNGLKGHDAIKVHQFSAEKIQAHTSRA